ncbi:MAG: alpha/beta fold hydrolase [Verrucomicrobiota bacterium]
MQIVFVHGIWDTGQVFRRMASFLKSCGHECHTPDLIPANAKLGLPDLAHKLKAFINEDVGPESTFAMVGFSMGALISRYYLQELGGTEQVSHFFSISGPQHGTLTAHFWLGKAARDMRFGSQFLAQLNRDTSSMDSISVRTYRTPLDLMILPSSSSKLEGATNRNCYAALHHRMLVQQCIFHDIAENLPSPA